MDSLTFKKTVSLALTAANFIKKGNNFIRHTSEVTSIVNLQKSDYTNGFYVNFSFFVNQGHESIANLRYVNGDIRGRFVFFEGGKAIELFDLDRVENTFETLREALSQNIDNYIKEPVTTTGLKNLITKHPQMLYQAKKELKIKLGFE